MGVVENISADCWPKQGQHLGERCTVYFAYDTAKPFLGTVIRDDVEAPHHTMIRLDDGRTVLSTECQYQPASLSVRGVRSGGATP